MTNGVMWRLLKTGCLTQQSLKCAGHSGSIHMGCSRLVAACDLGLVAAPCVVTNYPAGPRAPALVRLSLLGNETVSGEEDEGAKL